MSSANDMKSAEKTYNRFTGMLKWTVPLLAVIVLLIIIIIS
jgi:hypothetical protein